MRIGGASARPPGAMRAGGRVALADVGNLHAAELALGNAVMIDW